MATDALPGRSTALGGGGETKAFALMTPAYRAANQLDAVVHGDSDPNCP